MGFPEALLSVQLLEDCYFDNGLQQHFFRDIHSPWRVIYIARSGHQADFGPFTLLPLCTNYSVQVSVLCCCSKNIFNRFLSVASEKIAFNFRCCATLATNTSSATYASFQYRYL